MCLTFTSLCTLGSIPLIFSDGFSLNYFFALLLFGFLSYISIDALFFKESRARYAAYQVESTVSSFFISKSTRVLISLSLIFACSLSTTENSLENEEILQSPSNLETVNETNSTEENPKFIIAPKADETIEVTEDTKIEETPDIVEDTKVEEIPDIVEDTKVEEIPDVVEDTKIEETKVESVPQVQNVYYASSDSNKIHKSSCRWIKEINVSNLITFNSIEASISAGYEACKTCSPS